MTSSTDAKKALEALMAMLPLLFTMDCCGSGKKGTLLVVEDFAGQHF